MKKDNENIFITKNSTDWVKFEYNLNNNCLYISSKKIPFIQYFVLSVVFLIVGVIWPKIIQISIFGSTIFLALIALVKYFNSKYDLMNTTFNFETNTIQLKKYNKKISFSEVSEILFLNGPFNDTFIAEMQLVTIQEKYLLAVEDTNLPLCDKLSPEVLKILDDSFKIKKVTLCRRFISVGE